MKTTKNKAEWLRKTIDQWKEAELLESNEADKLKSSIEIVHFDWKKLARYCLYISISCLIISLVSILLDHKLLRYILELFNLSDSVKSLLFFLISIGTYYFAQARTKLANFHIYTKEIIHLIGSIFMAGSVYFLGKSTGLVLTHVYQLFALASLLYLISSIYTRSKLIWFLCLSSLSWAVAIGTSYPFRFVLLGIIVTLCSFSFSVIKKLKVFQNLTFEMGLLITFLSLWGLSIFGQFTRLEDWFGVKQIELIHWSILFTLACFVAIYLGLKKDNIVLRGYGIVFLHINLYTRYIEYLWDHLHKSVFFLVLALSFILIAIKAEKIWNLSFIKDQN